MKENFIALARKYRPQNFNDLIGQESVSQTLSLALHNNRLSHAYLFSGLRGSGKTSTARIFAKALVCSDTTSSNACEVCDNCVMANEGRHMDIIEMDGASNRGIDDIKDLIEHTKYKPSLAQYKIFIIDEVHMLTPPAFNALLKTLEEPPSFVKFILATTDPLKLPATILSRTQHFRFNKIAPAKVMAHLEYILDTEGVSFEKEALEIITRNGAGSLRDTLTLLDQAIVYSKNCVDLQTVTSMLGIIDPIVIANLFEDILAKKSDSVFKFLETANDYEAGMVVDEMILFLKEALLSRKVGITPNDIERFFKILAEARELLHIGSDGEFVLALSLFRMIDIAPSTQTTSQILPQEKILKPTEPITILTPVTPTKVLSLGEALFEKLNTRIMENDKRLGEMFRSFVEFVSFENATLTWKFFGGDEERKSLRENWNSIKFFTQDVFGRDIMIKNIPASTVKIQQKEEPRHNSDINVSSMIESEMNSSCVSGCSDAPIEKNETDILSEPMIQRALELFSPMKVRILRKS